MPKPPAFTTPRSSQRRQQQQQQRRNQLRSRWDRRKCRRRVRSRQSQVVASAQYGDTWRKVVTPLSIQVTKMPAGNVRGDHEDLPQQGDFIATYTASGSGTINIERTLAEERARRKSICKRHTKRSQIRRHQKVGSFYGICAESRWNCKHGVQASGAGRVSLTYRFNFRGCVD